MINMTDNAIDKVGTIMKEQQKEEHSLRMYVQGGGCSGLQYGLTFTDEIDPRDSSTQFGPVNVVIDPISSHYLKDAHVDYVETLMGGGFKIENPNATRSCGCGKSFAA